MNRLLKYARIAAQRRLYFWQETWRQAEDAAQHELDFGDRLYESPRSPHAAHPDEIPDIDEDDD